ncbi:MAG: hypothetical protein HY929_06380 [Euryarchaeota archaeon]|nr:hypothetical protein [Euryarchaeota archaeon]
MQYRLLKELEILAKTRKEKVTTIIAKAVEIGIDKIRQETILDQYLKGQIKREEAIKLIGLDPVKLAEKQKKAVLEDIKWGLHGS